MYLLQRLLIIPNELILRVKVVKLGRLFCFLDLFEDVLDCHFLFDLLLVRADRHGLRIVCQLIFIHKICLRRHIKGCSGLVQRLVVFFTELAVE